VILAGGSGTRLWPRSREGHPKHLLRLHDEHSLLQSTYARLNGLHAEIYVITERSQVAVIQEHLPELDSAHLIIEPARRGTASALGLAALHIRERDPEAVMLSLHADHFISDVDQFCRTLDGAATWADREEVLVLVGLRPLYPSSGLGYLEAGPQAPGAAPVPAYQVKRFVEKPDLKQAEEYARNPAYYWNLGLFSWRVTVLLEEIGKAAPTLSAALARVAEAQRAGDQGAAEAAYLELPNNSIDYAVLEKSRRLLMVPAQFAWSDIGSWADLHDILRQDEAGNVVEGEHILVDSSNCMIHAPGKLVAAVGLHDMVVIETDDAILICPKARSQDVKEIVARLKALGKDRYL
jgi:mannose-1-phosphate guanylyltransferase